MHSLKSTRGLCHKGGTASDLQDGQAGTGLKALGKQRAYHTDLSVHRYTAGHPSSLTYKKDATKCYRILACLLRRTLDSEVALSG